MDKGDFLRGYAPGNQLVPYVLIHAGFQPDRFFVNLVLRLLFRIILLPFLGLPFRFALGGGEIGENKLCAAGLGALLPDVEHVLHTGVDFTARVVRQQGIGDPLVQRQLAAIRGNLQHIILGGLNLALAYLIRTVS